MAIEFASCMQNMNASEIRELLKLTQRPEVISFGGGLPAPELFPIEELKEVSRMVLETDGRAALQYSTTEGYNPLREQIAARMNKNFQTNVAFDDILITNGSQQGLDFAGRLFLDKGDVVLLESPSYLGAINAFKAYMPTFVEVPTDEFGIIPEELDKILATTAKVKFIYVIPDFQNPTGNTYTLERRQKFMDVINKYEIPVFEDNPYGELRFEGEISPALKSMDPKGLVIYLGTFSKIFCPGMRIGWIAARPDILERFITIKQGADLQTSSIAQREIAVYTDTFDLDKHVKKIVATYRRRRDLFIKTMEEEFPDSVKFTRPAGGLFTWCQLPEHVNARDVLIKCLEQNVAFVPGGAFFPNGGKENYFRMNFSNANDEQLVKGLKRMAKVLKQYV